jgi:hypothetical protein
MEPVTAELCEFCGRVCNIFILADTTTVILINGSLDCKRRFDSGDGLLDRIRAKRLAAGIV